MAKKTAHCAQCNTLVYEDEQLYGYGLRCGCLKRYIMGLQKKLKEKSNGLDGH